MRSLTSDRFKFIEAPRPELYDLAQDPDETRNLYDERRPLADRMAAILKAADSNAAADVTPAADVDPDTRARLAALGYVGTFVATPAADRSQLADPKDKIELFNLIITAREQIHDDHDSDGGLKALRQVVARDPQVIDAWLMMGNEYSRRREFSRALESFQRALALKPDYDLAVFNMANVYRTIGKDDEALVGYRRLLELDPRNAQAHQAVAQVLVDHGKLEEAQDALNRALEIQPAMAAARSTLGALRLKQGDVSAGEREIRAALAQNANLRLAHFNLALAAEQRGDLERRHRGVQERDGTVPGELHGTIQSREGLRAAGERHRAARGLSSRDREQPRLRRGPPVPGETLSRPRGARGSDHAGAARHRARAGRRIRPVGALRASPTRTPPMDGPTPPRGRRQKAVDWPPARRKIEECCRWPRFPSRGTADTHPIGVDDDTGRDGRDRPSAPA